VGGSSPDRPERRRMLTEKMSKQKVYDDYVIQNNEYAQRTGAREPYHLTYVKKVKELINGNSETEDNREGSTL